jgi:hypothetical protein
MDVQNGCHESPSPHGRKRATRFCHVTRDLFVAEQVMNRTIAERGLAGGKSSHFARGLRTTVSKRPIEDATGSKTRDQRMIMSVGEDVSRCLDTLVEAKPSPTSIRSKSPRKCRCILDAEWQLPGPGLSRRKGGSQEGQQPKD